MQIQTPADVQDFARELVTDRVFGLEISFCSGGHSHGSGLLVHESYTGSLVGRCRGTFARARTGAAAGCHVDAEVRDFTAGSGDPGSCGGLVEGREGGRSR